MTSEGNGRPRTAAPRGLTREGFEALLVQLDPDREQAGERYETIRRRLVRLFEWRGCTAAEELTDETFNRVARRMAEGVELTSSDPYGYFCGVAHLVYKELIRQSLREHRALRQSAWPAPAGPAGGDEDADGRLEGLRLCLARLPQDNRDLVLRYHQGGHHIRNRQALAGELGIPLNALRIRVHRIRRQLEACVRDRLRR